MVIDAGADSPQFGCADEQPAVSGGTSFASFVSLQRVMQHLFKMVDLRLGLNKMKGRALSVRNSIALRSSDLGA